MLKNKELVVILIFAHKSEIDNFEKVSLMQCFKILGHYPIRLICPEGMDISGYREIIPSIEVCFIDPKWQSNYRVYNRLKISPFLYKLFKKYEFILTYELDAFVFQDELVYWCSQGYDYIGAPWHGGQGKALILTGVGNSGFSLRRVDRALKSLYSFSYVIEPIECWRSWQSQGETFRGVLSYLKNSSIANNSFFMFNNFKGNEDLFWGHYINQNFDWFKVASMEDALRFSFEIDPKDLFEKNNYRLPFGCHAWWKYDLNFWLPHIQKFGYLKDLKPDELR
jgi:hypothetical protein